MLSNLTNWVDLFIINVSFLNRTIGFLEDKLHVACNPRFLAVIKPAGKGTLKLRHEK